jgi:hypothetical protein
MSDWIEKDGKKYFDEGYLNLANQNARRRGEQVSRMRTSIETACEMLCVERDVCEKLDEDRLSDSLTVIRDILYKSLPY